MSKHIYEIIAGKEYKMAQNIATFSIKWMDDIVMDDLTIALGIDIEKNMAIWPGWLQVRNIPDELRSQFKVNRTRDGYLAAKKGSEINKKFLGIVAKHELKYYDSIELTMMFNPKSYNAIHWTRIIGQTNKPDDARFFFQLRDNVNELDIEYFDHHASLKQISGKNYFQLLADNEIE